MPTKGRRAPSWKLRTLQESLRWVGMRGMGRQQKLSSVVEKSRALWKKPSNWRHYGQTDPKRGVRRNRPPPTEDRPPTR
jgi:hypothetical protein